MQRPIPNAPFQCLQHAQVRFTAKGLLINAAKDTISGAANLFVPAAACLFPEMAVCLSLDRNRYMTAPTNMIFLLRAQQFDPVAAMLAGTLTAAGAKVVVVADERSETVNTGTYPKLTLDEQKLEQLGLTTLPANWGWFCGDMCYYLAAAHFPECEAFCLIESDVFVPASVASNFVETLHTHPADAIAGQLSPAQTSPKRYAVELAHLGLDPSWGCIFPVTRLSSQMVKTMFALRAEALASGLNLNDEAVLTGAVQRGSHSYAALEDVLPNHVQKEHFDTNPPHLYEALLEDKALSRLVHPAVMFEKIVERIRTGEKKYSRHRLRKVLRAAPKPMKKALKAALTEADAENE